MKAAVILQIERKLHDKTARHMFQLFSALIKEEGNARVLATLPIGE